MELRHNLFCVDAFAGRVGKGNPAGVACSINRRIPGGCR
jgi:predicted PhzF superfamily epimerase YddE/YHI9